MFASRRFRFSWRGYSWRTLGGDTFGGFIASLIAFPYGLAMAAAMGLPPVLGVFTSILTAPITAILGRNPVMIGGVSSVTVPFIVVAVHQQGIGGAAKVSFVAAILMLIFSTQRLGRFVSLVPHSVMAGFSCGIGGMMVVSQLRVMMGLKNGAADAGVLRQLAAVADAWAVLHWQPLATALLVIAAATLAARLSPKLPAPLLGVLVAVLFSRTLGWSSKEVGWLPASLPPFQGFTWAPTDVFTVLPAGLGLAFVTSVNLLVTSRVVEHFRGRHEPMRPSDADRELGAYGIANLAAAAFGAPMSVGIPARSLANVQCGATTRVSNVLHAAFLVLFIVQGKSLIAHIPMAALAGVTAWMGLRLMEWSTWFRLHRMRKVDAAAFLSTAAAALLSNAVLAVALGCSCYAARHLLLRHRRRFAQRSTTSLLVTENTPGTPLA